MSDPSSSTLDLPRGTAGRKRSERVSVDRRTVVKYASQAMKFIDEAVIHVKAGDGGNGSAAFRREDGVPRGGPSGGDGGDGGSIVVVADPRLSSLLDYKYRRHYTADRGEDGRNKDQYGARGEDLVLRVPVGTVVYVDGVEAPRGMRVEDAEDAKGADAADDAEAADEADDANDAVDAEDVEDAEDAKGADAADDAEAADEAEDANDANDAADAEDGDAAEDAEDGERVRRGSERGVPLADLAEPGSKFVLARGGKGGRGNIHFKTPWNQAPRTAEPGTPGEQRMVRLELKLLADVGLLGYPNVGKSTFIRRVSRARPKVAEYPFTTLVPNLGVVQLSDERNFVIADIPGLIEGASEGAGLGHQFLRHVERCRVLVHIVEATFTTGPDRSPLHDFDVINSELARYAPELSDKPQVVVLNKIDATASDDVDMHRHAFSSRGVELLTMSAATGAGINAVLERVWSHLDAARGPKRTA
jgi:GTP-binding protein